MYFIKVMKFNWHINIVLIVEIIFVLFSFLRPGFGTLLCIFLTLFLIFIYQLFEAITKKNKKSLSKVIITFIIGLSIIPLNFIGNEYGPTFGKDIKYNKILWKYPINDNIKYYMASDIIKTIMENKYKKLDVINILGKPNANYDDENVYEYQLKYDEFSIFVWYSLYIYFQDDICKNAYIKKIVD